MADSTFYEPYKAFATSLRTWFVAYGIGAPLVFLSNDSTRTAISKYEHQELLVALFLGGVVLQILEAMLYKHAMWHLYYGEGNAGYQNKLRYKVSDAVSEAYWLGVIFDLGTLVVYGFGTWHAFLALVAPA